MKVTDIMSTNVATVAPDTSVKEVAMLMVQRRISGVPVVDEGGHVIGLISEGDLIRRPEMATDKPLSRWASLMTGQEQKARDFIKTHGLHAQEVMTPAVVTINADATLNEAAGRMEKNKIKRLPVVEGGKLIGILTRADLLRALATSPDFKLAAPQSSDRAIRDELNDLLRKEDWAATRPESLARRRGGRKSPCRSSALPDFQVGLDLLQKCAADAFDPEQVLQGPVGPALYNATGQDGADSGEGFEFGRRCGVGVERPC